MKKHICIICSLAFALLVQCVPAQIESTPPHGGSWPNLVTNDFCNFLKKVTASDEGFKWASAAGQKASIQAHTVVQNSALDPEGTILRQLLSYPASLPGLTVADDKEVAKNVSLLQDFRDVLMKNPSYSNLLLADTVNRGAHRVSHAGLYGYQGASGASACI
jgi:hypothetical protein